MKDGFGNKFAVPLIELKYEIFDSEDQSIWSHSGKCTFDQTAKFQSSFPESNETSTGSLETLVGYSRDTIIEILIASGIQEKFPNIPDEYRHVSDLILVGDVQLRVPLPIASQSLSRDLTKE